MNRIYKLVWSKTKNMYVAASEFAKSHTKSPSGSTMSRTMVAGVLASVISCGAIVPAVYAETNPTAGTNYVVYTDDTGVEIQLEGNGGTKITNVAAGQLSAGSLDAVNGAQLYALTQEFDDFQSALSRNNTSIARAQTDINNIKATNLNLQSQVNTLDTQVSTGFNVNISGAKVKAVNPASNYINFKAGDGVSITNDNESIKIALSTDGVVASENKGAITGDTAYTELRPVDANYVRQANTTAANLGALDTQLKTVTDGLATEVTNRQNADTALSDRIGTIPEGSTGQGHHLEADKSIAENLANLDSALGDVANNAVLYDGADKSKVTLGGTDGTTIDNVKAATLDANSKEAVNGSQLFQTNQALNQEIVDRTEAVNTEKTAREAADTAINNKIGSIDENGNYIDKDASVFTNLSALDTQVKANADATGTLNADGSYIRKDNNVSQNLTVLDTNLKRVDDALTQEIQNRTNADTELRNQINQVSGNSVNYDGEDKTKVTLAGEGGTTIANVKDGTLAEGSKEAVTGGQLYTTNQNLAKEITDRTQAVSDEATARADADTALSNRIGTTTAGNYVQADKNVGENLGLLDAGLATEKTERETAVTNLENTINNLSENAVQYDDETKAKVSLGGAENTTGTTIDKVKAGTLSADSMEAVNGSQLFTTNQNLEQEVQDRTDADTALQNQINSLTGNAVKYDNDEKTSITLGGGESGTTITNVKDGALAEGSKDAVTGGQLYTTNQKLQKEIDDRTDAVNDLRDDLNSLTGNAVTYDSEDKSKVTLAGGENGTTISNVKDGTLAEDSKEAVTGGQLYTTNQNLVKEIADRTQAVTDEITARTNADNALSDRIGTYAEGTTFNYINANNNVVTNLGALDTQAKVNADAIAAEVRARQEAITNITNNLGTLSGNAVQYDDDSKSIVTFGGTSGTKLTKVKAGTLSASSMDAVNGSQLFQTNQNISGFAADINRNKENIRELNTSVTAALESVSSTSVLVDTIDSLKADASLNNLTAAGRQVISTAAANAVQEYIAAQGTLGVTRPVSPTATTDTADTGDTATAGTTNQQLSVPRTLAARPMMLMNTGSGTATDSGTDTSGQVDTGSGVRLMNANPGAGTNYVVYDDATASTVTLEGAVGEGTKITNLADGELSAASTDAVTGSQLYAVTQQFDDFQSALSRNNTSIARAQTDINNIKTTNLNLQSAVNTLNTQMEAGMNVTVDGALVKNVNPDSNYVNLTTGNHMEITNDNGSVKISAKTDGAVASGNTGIVSGAMVYNAIQDAIAGSETGTGVNLAHKANTDASNVGVNAETDNSVFWGEALGNGDVAENDKRLISGATLFNEVRPPRDGDYISSDASVAENLKSLDIATKNNSDDIASLKDMSDMTDTGQTVIRNIAKGAIKVIDGTNTTVTKGTEGDADTYAVNVTANGQAEQGNTGLVTGGTLYNAIQDAIAGSETGTGEALGHKANTDASNVGVNATTDNSELWGLALGTGSVATDDNKLISGKTLFNEVRVTDGNYVTAGNTVAQNLNILDTQLKTTSDAVAGMQDLSSITDAGKTVIKNLAKDAVKVVNGTNTTVTEGTQGEAKTYAVNVSANGTVTEGNTGLVSGGTVYTAIRDAVGDISFEPGTISPDSNGFVTGKQVYNEIHTNDGEFVRGTNTTGENLKALDDAVKDIRDNSIGYDNPEHTSMTLGDGTTPVGLHNIADGTVAQGSKDAVNGGQLYDTNQRVTANENAISDLQDEMDNKADKNLSNLTDAAKEAIRNIAGNPIDVVSSNGTVGVGKSTVDGKTVYDLSVNANGVVAAGNTGLVTGDTVYNAIRSVTGFTGNATGEGAIAIGGTANGKNATEVGTGSEAIGDESTAIGSDNKVNGNGSTSVGHDNEVTGIDSTAVGANNSVTGDHSNTVGSGNTIIGNYTNVYGNDNTTNGDQNNIFGNNNTTEGNNNSVVGNTNSTKGDSNNILGSDNTVEGDNNSLVGNTNTVTGDQNSVTGNTNMVTSNNMSVNGNENNITGNRGTVVGHGNEVTGDESHIHGNDNNLNGDYNYIFGSNTTVTGDRDTAIGLDNTVSATNSHTVGNGNNIEGNDNHAFGNGNHISSENGTAVGNTNTVTGIDSGAFGQRNTVAGNGSYVVGNDNTVVDGSDNTFVLGSDVNVTGKNTVVLGKGSDGSQDNVISVGSEGGERKIVHVADGTVAEGSKDAVNGGQLYQVQQDVRNANDIDASKWAEKLGVGEVVEGNKDLVTGGTVYDAIRKYDVTDGAFKVDNENGTIRIGGDARHDGIDFVDISKSDGSDRVLTGVATNPKDATSAANVGYVNAVGQNILDNVNSGFNRMNDKVNKVGANAAALASLMPAPMDGGEKWSVSAAFGNYRSSTAGALGIFYQPQDNVIMNLRGAVGNGENMIGGGVSIALNKGNMPSVNKAQLVRAVNAQANKITEQNNVIAAQNEKIAALEAVVRQVVAKQNSVAEAGQ